MRRSVLALGLVSSLVGLSLIVTPSLGTSLSPVGVVRTTPFAIIGIAAILLAGGYGLAEARYSDGTGDESTTDRDALPTPEDRPPYAPVGTAFARRLRKIEWAERRERDPTNRVELLGDLREAARRVLSQTEAWTPAAIETQLDEGSWTRDARAAAFFTDGVVPSLSLRQKLASLRSTEPVFAERARHVVAELASRSRDVTVSRSLAETGNRAPEDAPATTIRQYWESDVDETTRDVRTGRTRGVTIAALAAGGLGIVTLHPALLLLSIFGVTVAGYARIASAPTGAVEVRRSLSDGDPEPGDVVEVTVVVRNASDGPLADLRLVDGVPAGLTVIDGSPRFSTALRPGKEVSFSYSVEAVHGCHVFDPSLLLTRDVTGIRKRERLVEPEHARTVLTCRLPTLPTVGGVTRRRTTIHAGQSRSSVAGSGVEFHSVREYRPGDPLSRIDWKRTAKTGEFTTVDFREFRLARVLVVVDARAETYVTTGAGSDQPIVQRGVVAGHHLTSRLLAESIPVGLTAFSPRSCWLAPGAGDAHRRRIQEALSSDPAFGWIPPSDAFDADTALTALHQRLPIDTQVVFVSPLCDDEAVTVARRLDAYGYTTAIVSPNPTASTVTEPDLAWGYGALEREFRLSALRNADIPVSDWTPTESFATAVFRDA